MKKILLLIIISFNLYSSEENKDTYVNIGSNLPDISSNPSITYGNLNKNIEYTIGGKISYYGRPTSLYTKGSDIHSNNNINFIITKFYHTTKFKKFDKKNYVKFGTRVGWKSNNSDLNSSMGGLTFNLGTRLNYHLYENWNLHFNINYISSTGIYNFVGYSKDTWALNFSILSGSVIKLVFTF